MARNYYSAADRKNIKVCDMGCGSGANTWYLCNEGFDVYGFDGSESAIEQAKIVMNGSPPFKGEAKFAISVMHYAFQMLHRP